jgi:small-conductance mechanosensitive channel/CRP-like cAMP-binding protein
MTDSTGQFGLPIVPAALLMLGFPLTLLVLTELVNSGQRRGWMLAPTLRAVRTFVVPALAIMLFVTHVWQLPADRVPARLVQTAFWLCVLYAALSLVNDGLFGSARPGSWQARVPKLFRDLARTVLIGVGAAIIYSQVWGQEISGALTALGLGSIVIGLALQEPLGNLVSGLMLLFERPLDIGDWVIADGTTGRVIEINWRSVHIETLLHEMRIIPNVSLYKNSFSNLSRPTHDRTETYDIGLSYDHPPSEAKQALLGLLQATPGVLRQPPPEVHTVEYADSSIIYRLYFTVARYEDMLPVRDEVLSRIWYVTRRHGLQIPYPIRMQYRYPEPTSAPQPTAAELLERFPRYHVIRDAMLAAPAAAASLADATAAATAAPAARVLTFAPGEEMLPFGATHHGFSLLAAGQVGLSARDAGGRDVRFATLSPGDFYGEATLSASRPSDFRVVADTDATVVNWDASVVAGLLEQSSGLAAEIGDAIDARRRAALAIRQRAAAEQSVRG